MIFLIGQILEMYNSRVNKLKDDGFDADVLFADSRSETAIKWAKEHGPYDLVFIDGLHTYEGVKSDWENYGPMGKIVAFHDVKNPYEQGVGKFWQEIKHSHKCSESVHSTMGIGLVNYRDMPITGFVSGSLGISAASGAWGRGLHQPRQPVVAGR